MSVRKDKIKVFDMTCTSCENRVERAVKKLPGVSSVKANFSGQYAEIQYDDEQCNKAQIKKVINGAGYTTESSKDYKFIGILFVVAAIVLLGINTSGFDMEAKLTNASYAVLFVVGVFTSIHCVGMCGGIMISQSIGKETKSKFEAMQPAIFYNLGRVISYTILGGIIGAIGSVFALSLTAKAGLQIFAGIFMIMMGFNMAGFSLFRKFQIKLPKAACRVQSKPRTPFLVGFLNGLMPCGPLQTMQIFALGTGSATSGALSMFMFALGTVPLMLTFGAVSGLLSKGYTKKILKFSGILIIVLGIIMGNRGFALAGMNPMDIIAKVGSSNETEILDGAVKATMEDGVQVLNMTASYEGYTPNVFYVQKGTPVKWVIDGQQLTGCNSTIVIPDLKIEQKLQSGENIIEFTPGNKDLNFSCWMGMIRGIIKVVDDLEAISASESDSSGSSSSVAPTDEPTSQPKPSIYGTDLNQVATDRLINKALISNNEQTIEIKGTGYELEPLIVVANTGIPTQMALDLTAFDNPEGDFAIVNATTLEILQQFTGQKGTVGVDFTPSKGGSYGILINDEVIGFIEVVENIDSVNLEDIRSKYFQ